MFTGLIEEVGVIKKIISNTDTDSKEMRISSKKVLKDINIGDSISMDGVCLSVTSKGGEYFSVQAVMETVNRSTLRYFKIGELVNLERAMLATDRFGGHFVQGHVDGVAEVIAMDKSGNSSTMQMRLPEEIAKYTVIKGSITVNGVSLTISGTSGVSVKISLIPLTLRNTNLGLKKKGDLVNIEVDIIAKYVERFINSKFSETLTLNKIGKWGYGTFIPNIRDKEPLTGH
jgi:riboflavin synthase